jgi:O-antigen ligase
LRLAGIALACIGLAAAWPMVRAIASKISYRQLAIGVSLAIGVTAVVWLTAGYTSTVTSTGGGFGHGRISYWHAAVDAWTQRPLLGSGAGTFYQASVAYQQNHDMTSFAHNLPLELAAELGIPGFLLGLALYATSALELKRAVRFPDAWLLAPTAACFLLANLVDWPWHLAGLGAMWAAAIGALASTRSRAPRQPHGSALTVSLAWPYRGRSLRRRRR